MHQFKRVVYGFTTQSHIGGLALLAMLALFASGMTVQNVGGFTTLILTAVAAFGAVPSHWSLKRECPPRIEAVIRLLR